MTLNRTNHSHSSNQVIPQKRSATNSNPSHSHSHSNEYSNSHPHPNTFNPTSFNPNNHSHNHNHGHSYHSSRPSHLDPATHHSVVTPAQYDPRATIVLIGMRGVGKTTLGLIASTALSRRFIDTDSVFETLFSTTIAKYVSTHGWTSFRTKESEVLRRVLNKYPKDAVISCGGGIVDSSESREILKGWKEAGPVILVLRERDEVLKELTQEREKEKNRELSDPNSNQGTSSTSSSSKLDPNSQPDQRPDWGEAVKDVWRRREPLFWESSSHAFVSLTAKASSNPIHSPDGSMNEVANINEHEEVGIISKENPATSLNPITKSRSGTATPIDTTQNDSSNLNINKTEKKASNARTMTTTSRRLPNHPLALKPVEESFLRLIKFILSDPATLKPVLEKSPTPVNSRPSSPTGFKPPTSFSNNKGKETKNQKSKLKMPGPPDVTSRSSLLSTTSSFLSLSFPDLRDVPSTTFSRVIEGVDCLEIRADLLDCLIPASTSYRQAQTSSLLPNSILPPPVIDFSELALQIETIRFHSRGLPILFTVRSQREGGAFHDDRDHKSGSMKSLHSESLYFKLLDLASKMGIEIIDIEMAWSPSSISSFLSRRGRTRCKLSYHDLSGALRWDSNHSIALYERAFNFGADLVGLYGFARLEKPEQNWHLLSFQAKILANARNDKNKNGKLLPPLTAINMGDQGRVTRTFNPTLTPVAHPAQPTIAAPGQMSVRDIGKARSGLGFGGLRRFYLYFGQEKNESNLVRTSLEAGVSVLGLPHFISYLPPSSAFALQHSGDENDQDQIASKGKGKAVDYFAKTLNLPLEFENEEFGGAFFGGFGTSLLQERLKGRVGGVEVELESEEEAGKESNGSKVDESQKNVIQDGISTARSKGLEQEGGFLPSTRDSELVGAVDLIVRLENHGLLSSLSGINSSTKASKTNNVQGNRNQSISGSGANPAGLHAALSALGSTPSTSTNQGPNPKKDSKSGRSSPSTPSNPTKFINNPSGNGNDKTLLADHTLPKSIERLICSNLSPINAPGPTSAALVVILDPPQSTKTKQAEDVEMNEANGKDQKALEREKEKAEYDSSAMIAAKSTVMAISRLGFGKCVIAEMKNEDQDSKGEGKESSTRKKQFSTPNWVHPTQSLNGTETADQNRTEWWADSISNSILEETIQHQTSHQVSEALSNAQVGYEANTYKCQPFFLGLESLKDLPQALVEASSGLEGNNNAPNLKAGRPASVIVLIGGSAETRKKAIKFLDHPILEVDSIVEQKKERDEDVEMKESSTTTQEKEVETQPGTLPSEIWDSPMGGVVLCIPCSSSSSTSTTTTTSTNTSNLNQVPPISYSSPSLLSDSSHSALSPSLHRNGWLVLPNRLLELERLTRGVFEPWTRKRAPRASMGKALEG